MTIDVEKVGDIGVSITIPVDWTSARGDKIACSLSVKEARTLIKKLSDALEIAKMEMAISGPASTDRKPGTATLTIAEAKRFLHNLADALDYVAVETTQ